MSVPTDRPRITITLDLETSHRLEALSEETGQSKSHLALQALKIMLQESPSVLKITLSKDVAARLSALAQQNFRSPEDEARLAISLHLKSAAHDDNS